MPAVAYPRSPMPAAPLTPVRTGPRYPTDRLGLSRQRDPVTDPAFQAGDPTARSGPVHSTRLAGPMDTVGWGAYLRVALPHSGRHGHGRKLADRRQLHYRPPGTIPGPGGDYLVAPQARKALGPPQDTPPVTLATVARGMKPKASSVSLPAGAS